MLISVAAVLQLFGHRAPIAASSAWWLWFVSITNVACILFLSRAARSEGLRLRDIYYFNPTTWRADVRWFLIGLAGIAVVGLLPGILLSGLLWSDPNYPNALLLQPLPVAAVLPLFVIMPTTQALAELPIYWGYVAPRLRAGGMNRWLVVAIVGGVLSLQHVFFSFQLDPRYIVWLALRFLPFALWTGVLVDRRPTVLPYLMAVHFLMDASLPVLTYLVSTGVLVF